MKKYITIFAVAVVTFVGGLFASGLTNILGMPFANKKHDAKQDALIEKVKERCELRDSLLFVRLIDINENTDEFNHAVLTKLDGIQSDIVELQEKTSRMQGYLKAMYSYSIAAGNDSTAFNSVGYAE